MMESRKKITFTCNDLPKRNCYFFEDMWRKKELCDISFHIGSDSVQAHKIIITAAIPYLRRIFSNNDRQGEEEGICLVNIEPKAFRSLIEYSYTCKLEIDVDNAMNILSAACYLGMDEVKEACCDFLAENLDFENIFCIREFANNLNCLELLTSIDYHVRENFYDIVETEQFLSWPLSYLKEIIGGDDLYVDSEQTVLDAAIKWLRFCPEERKGEFPDLLRKIRLHEVDPLYLVDIVEREEPIRASLPIRDLIEEAKHYNLFPQRRKSIGSFPTERRQCMRNTPQNDDQSNFQIFKFNDRSHRAVQCFDSVKGVWQTKGSRKYYTTSGSTVALGNKMYFFHWGYTLQYDLANNSFKYISNVPGPCLYIRAVASNGKIYVVGGMLNQNASSAVRCFDPEMDVWTEVRSMRTSRWAASVVALSRYIFVLGGQNNSSVFDCVERYDPETNKWKTMKPMLTKRCSAGTSSVNGKIYVCGGVSLLTRIECIATAEMYDPIRNAWMFIKPLNSPRRDFILLPFNSKLYALGGNDSDGKFLTKFDIYHPESDEWMMGPSTDPAYEVSGAMIMPVTKS